ncbi:hypothetical protein L602_002100000180 [Cupriavidus gilardii J11]|uniref:Uncharacterized protein n=1 Tax=Cupriavidus gilardii J11 TaxID=936133 RepID=A0A562BMR2_9BURK|nr:hypothetical protein L602_002100000180 [Cupriavidus gilardii J11]
MQAARAWRLVERETSGSTDPRQPPLHRHALP